MSDWPDKYVPDDDTTGSPAGPPNWDLAHVKDAGSALVLRMMRDPDFSKRYLGAVKRHYRNRADYTTQYAALIGEVYTHPGGTPINAHDFANVHRLAWLRAVAALSQLVGFNPYRGDGDNGSGDPPQNGTRRRAIFATGHGHFMFEVPNATGYYAVRAGS
jgi:hypothetical protein